MILLMPSAARVLALDKGYRVLVDAQGFAFGRDGNAGSVSTALRTVVKGSSTGIPAIVDGP